MDGLEGWRAGDVYKRQPLLSLDHRGKVIFRMSVNPQPIISRIELGTSSLKERIQAGAAVLVGGIIAGSVISNRNSKDDKR